jgi:hypothetical protein
MAVAGWKLELFCCPPTTFMIYGDAPASELTRQQIGNFPRYQEFKQYWEEDPVMNLKNSDRIIASADEPVPAKADSKPSSTTRHDEATVKRAVNIADLFPSGSVAYSGDPAPGTGKVTLRPLSVPRAEEAASGVTLLKPHWGESFENYLRLNRDDIRAKWSQCEPKAA